MADAIHRCADCDGVRYDPRAHENAPCPSCGGRLRRYVRAPPGSVVLDRDHAEAALFEVEAAIRRTGGPDGFEVGQHEREAMTPLAMVRRELEARPGFSPTARAVIRDVGELTGEETNPDADPLTDATFQARDALRAALGHAVEEPAEAS